MRKNQTIYRLPLFRFDLMIERQKVTSIRYYAIEPPSVRHTSVRDDDASVLTSLVSPVLSPIVFRIFSFLSA